jgi:hypothetical protein
LGSILRITRFLFLFISALSVAADPTFDLTSRPPRIEGFAVGTKVVWMAMVRERVDDQSQMTILRGHQTIDASGKLEVDRLDRDFTRSLWILAEVGGTTAVRGSAPGYDPLNAEIVVRAEKGADRLTIQSQSVHLTWIAGDGSWTFGGADGGAQDEDGVQNGVIVLRLTSMRPVKGKSAPPASLSAGDRFLLIDPDENRMTVVAVRE